MNIRKKKSVIKLDNVVQKNSSYDTAKQMSQDQILKINKNIEIPVKEQNFHFDESNPDSKK